MADKRKATNADNPEDSENVKKTKVDDESNFDKIGSDSDMSEGLESNSDCDDFDDWCQDVIERTSVEETKDQLILPTTMILSEEDLRQEMNNMISDVVQKLSLPHSVVVLLLQQFSYNSRNLIESYYERSREDFIKLGIYLPDDNDGVEDLPAHQPDDEVLCKICMFKSFNPSSITVYPPCGHKACEECTVDYLKYQISDMNIRIQCPFENCKTLLDEKYIRSLLKGHPDTIQIYEKLFVEDFVAKVGYLKYCTYPDCKSIWKVNPMFIDLDEDCHEIVCTCQENFCITCAQPWHFPLSCKILRLWKERLSEDSETATWLNLNAKFCPYKNCQAPIEKNGGCNVMTCSKCKGLFCWICMVEMKSYEHFCRSNKVDLQGDTVELKTHIQRFIRASERFIIHGTSYQLERKLLDTPIKPNPLFNLSTFWYIDAVKVLLSCRRLLQYSFPFVFFLEESPQVEIFTTNMMNLHNSVEALSRNLENLETTIADSTEFESIRQNVLSLTSFCKLRRTKLMEHVNEGFGSQDSEWNFQKDLVPSDGERDG